MVMREDIIGVVGARPVVEVFTHRSSFDELAGNSTITPILVLKGARENFIDVLRCHRSSLAGEVDKLRFRAQLNLVSREGNQIVLSDKVANSVKKLGTDDFRGRRHLGIAQRVKL